MGLFSWADKKIKKLTVLDMALTKISVGAFVLMVAKLWEPLLSLDWYWYAGICVLGVIIILSTLFKK